MAAHGEAYELRSTGKDISVTADRNPSPQSESGATSKQETLTNRQHEGLSNSTRIRRLFSEAQLFAFALTFMSTWVGMNTNIFFALYQGGPQTFAWGVLIVYIGAITQAASIAEMSSTLPIAGAQYHWTHHLAPRRIRRFATWMQGWFTWFGWVSLECGIANITAIMVQQMAMLNNPNYVPKNWHITLIMIAMLIIHGAINSTSYTFALVPWLELLAGILYVCLFVIFMCVYLVLGTRHSTDYTFFHREVSSGWNNEYVAWNLGLLTCVWSFTGFDGTVHMSEETKKAKQAVPRATLYSIMLNGALGYCMAITLITCMGPMETVLESGFPVATILQRITGSVAATTALIAGLFIFSFCLCIASIASVSRLTWAWSRDGGLPRYLAHVHPRHLVPVRAVWFSCLVVALLSLLNVGSTAAFGAITSLSSMALYFSYAIAISSMLFARWTSTRSGGNEPLELGEWNLGSYGVYINAYALVHTVYMWVWLPLPQTLPVTAENMNYAGPIFVAVLLFALGSWFLRARHSWAGPNPLIVDYIKSQE
ncbi:uncharacterized protein HMPREF1541_03356 [Cyphellophora europaea CBS 101466]|uniref:Uncharacterized protein n=1 Tax=Cyphellophora europaea (strain CBS 101466) TaxID=1220924 RepID=W2RY54_CYPE1|nr:uncharacterized protein HMPREF1541_03356 [Cyphellophora europaea CBS 101466]ETN41421.1 hypothetical protein HMPREF1541_03356 [Cyphellophora europaea CBS 101466]